MKYQHIGTSDLNVSRICLGTMTFGDQNTQEEAFAQMDYAVAHGVNFFDTAELYPTMPISPVTQGRTEEIIGNWFQKRGSRDQIILASKIAGSGRLDWIRDGEHISGDAIDRALEGNLKRLQTDYIDLYQLHWPNRGSYHFAQTFSYQPENAVTQRENDNFLDVVQKLDTLVKAGKIRAWGLSNEMAWGTMRYVQLAKENGLTLPVSIQNEYSLLYRRHDLDMSEVSLHEKIDLLPYSALATGLLSGKYSGGNIPENSRLTIHPNLHGRFVPQALQAADAYVTLAKKNGLDPSQMALAFTLTRPFVASTIIGATHIDQLAKNIAAVDVNLSPKVMAEIQELYKKYPMVW